MRELHGRRRYTSLLRLRERTKLRSLKSAISKAKTKLRSLKSAASKGKSKRLLLRNHSMRIRRKNSLRASKLAPSLRRSALRNLKGKVCSSLHTSDSPETLTKRGKISRVSERTIHKIASPRVSSTEQDEKEEGNTFVANRRMTRAMDAEETRKLDASRSTRFKGFNGEKTQDKDVHGKSKHKFMRKRLKNSVSPAPSAQDHMEMENTLYRKKLRHHENNLTEKGEDKHQAMSPDPLMLENGNHRLNRLDIARNGAYDSLNKLDEAAFAPSNQDPKRLSQAKAVLKSLRRQKRLPLTGGVTTRHKASSITQAQPLLVVDTERELNQGLSCKHSQNSLQCIEEEGLHDSSAAGNVHSGKAQRGKWNETEAGAKSKKRPRKHANWLGVVNTSPLNNVGVLTRTGKGRKDELCFGREGGGHLTRGRGMSEDAQGSLRGGARKGSHPDDTQPAYTAPDHKINLKCKLKKSRKGGSGSVLLQSLKKRRTMNRLNGSKQISTSEASLQPNTSRRKLTEKGLREKKLTSTPRRSKRKRTTACLEVLNDHEAVQKGYLSFSKSSNLRNDTLQVRGQTEDIAVRDAFYPKGTSLSIEHMLGNDVVMVKVPSAPKVGEDEMEPSLDVSKMDSSSKCCLVARNPTDTGGRQMRPRPLDLEQPLLILVEGLDRDYYEFDGGSFYRMLQQQPESNNPFISKVKSDVSNKRTLDGLDVKGKKSGPILIPSFRSQIKSDDSLQNSGLPYALPESYIKGSSECQSCQAEYDMDDEDEEWLNNYNQSLSPASTLSADQFEKIIDLLENKAADASGLNSITEVLEEDQEPISEECCICNGGENSVKNLVYQCSSCHILVHESCYGIQRGGRNRQKKLNWNCRKCEAVAEGKEIPDISCSLCCKQGGALKPTTEPHKWAHVVCALYTNETYFVNPDAMEPIDGLDAADARAKRQKRQCWLCGMREGSVERCSVPGCKTVFHVSCGVTQGASFELQHFNHQVISVRVYCPKHALSAFDAAKTRSEEGEKENQNLNFQSSPSHEELFPAAEEISSHNHQTRKQGKRRSLGQGRASRQGASDSGRDLTGMSNGDSILSGCTEQGYIDKSLKGGVTYELAKERRAVNGVSGEEVCEALISDNIPEIGHATPGLMEGLYLYWVSKRAREGGALLHRIQQEHAARQFGIFNSDDDVGPATIAAAEGSFLSHSVTDMKVVAARQQLQKLQELTLLVVQRERLKLDIFTLDQNILKVSLEALNVTGTSQQCFFCKETHFSLVCTVCNRASCMYCLTSRKALNCKRFLDFLKLPKHICLDCEKQNNQIHRELAHKPCVDWEDDCLDGSCTIRSLKKSFGIDKLLENSQISLHKKPLILLPRPDGVHQDKLAMEVFWEQIHPKTALISDLLKNPL
eukprot:c24810_g1_i1 orf=295-4452(+)